MVFICLLDFFNISARQHAVYKLYPINGTSEPDPVYRRATAKYSSRWTEKVYSGKRKDKEQESEIQ